MGFSHAHSELKRVIFEVFRRRKRSESIRSGPGFASAAERGASIFRMMDVSRHKSVDTVRGYVRQAEEFTDHAGQGLL